MLGRSLVSRSIKKQNSVALSTAEAEYIAAGACCAQILYMKQTLLDFGVKLDRILLLCDNESVRSEKQLADIFTKPLDESTFVRLRKELNVLDTANVM